MGSGGSKLNNGSISSNVQQRYVQLKKRLRAKRKDREENSNDEMHGRKDSSNPEVLSLPPPSGNENIENSSSRKSLEGNYTSGEANGGGNNVVDENDEDHYDERMITRRDDSDEFQASPSFRVYCTPDNGLAGEALSDEDETEEADEEKNQKVEVKAGKQGKMRSIIKVIPTGGQIKNLLTVNSCSPRSQGRNHTEKSDL